MDNSGRVSDITSSIAQTVGTKTIAIGSIVGVSLSISRPLGNMDNSGRVSDITSSSGITSSNSRGSRSSKTSNVSAGRGAVGSISSGIANTIGVSSISSIAQTKSSIAQTVGTKTIAIGSIVGISISISHGTSGQTENSQELVHVDCFSWC